MAAAWSPETPQVGVCEVCGTDKSDALRLELTNRSLRSPMLCCEIWGCVG